MTEYTYDVNEQAFERGSVEGDSRDEIPNLPSELRKVVVDQIRNDPPSSVLGMLIESDEPLTVETIAGTIAESVERVEWTVEMLEQEDLCVRVTVNGLAKVATFAAFSARNP